MTESLVLSSPLQAVFVLSYMIWACAALQALLESNGISLQLGLDEGSGGWWGGGCCDWVKMWEASLFRVCFSSGLKPSLLTQTCPLPIVCGNKMNAKTKNECKNLQYLQAVSLVLLETTQGLPLNPNSSWVQPSPFASCYHYGLKNLLQATGLGQRPWLRGKENGEMPEVPAMSALNHRIP